ncbi:MAG: hypothetical protein F4Z31_21130 [Gemmatimonadetes bacterium]|nr:hypothetical protein [Gemmatimonadota bacterium]
MRRVSLSGARAGGLPLALTAALALAAGACMSPAAKQGSAAGTADRQAAKAGDEKEKGKSRTWWERITQSHPEPKEKPVVYGDVRPGKGLLSNDEDGFVLLRKGEGDLPDRRNKPEKVRR